MTERQQSEDDDIDAGPENDDEPQVFAVRRDLDGWQFNRRDFLRAAAVSTVGAVGLVACRTGADQAGSGQATAAPTRLADTATPTLAPTQTPTATPTVAPTRAPTSTPAGTLNATPTETPEAAATPAGTDTPTATATSVPVPAAQFVSDVTIPDGTEMQPGQSFTKTWRVRNSGTLDWGTGSQVVFASGAQMGGASPTSVADTKPGDVTDISIAMVAPAEAGSHKGNWRLSAGDGTAMATLTVVIQVVAAGQPGTGPETEERTTFTGPGGETRWLPCGSAIPDGWTCTCNCVASCGCVGHCSCDNVCSCDQVCTCDSVCTCEGHGHYWYPN